MSKAQPLTVSQLNTYIHNQFEQDPNLNQLVYLTGEISNFRLRDRHQYFNLKDANSSISAVMFQSAFRKIKFEPEEGMKVTVVGTVSTYIKNGQYQIYLQRMEPDGVGQLYQALKQLEAKLLAEGLFDSTHKKPLPRYPKKIGVITSPNGAVIRDIIKTVRLRYPLAQVVLYPAVVQGDQSAGSLLRQLQRLEQRNDIDTIIIGRGGGSIEDLWSFNDEQLARAIYDCPIPIISSVGHETDVTLADHVADRRAATPTAAAEFAVPELGTLKRQVAQLRQALVHYFTNQVQHDQMQLAQLTHNYIFQHPEKLYAGYLQRVQTLRQQLVQRYLYFLKQQQQTMHQLQYKLQVANPKARLEQSQHQLQNLQQQLKTAMQTQLQIKQQRYHALTTSLQQLNPKAIMKNGYSYVTKDHQVVNDVNAVQLGDVINLNMFNGHLKVKIIEVGKDE